MNYRKKNMRIHRGVLTGLAIFTFSLIGNRAHATDIVFIVDESGSMSGEHGFLQQQIGSMQSGLTAAGITDTQFGLVGYGDGNVIPKSHLIDGQLFGDATAFSTAARGLLTDGGTEDGYAGIDFAMSNYYSGASSTFFVLVTDEDRDIINGAEGLTYESIRQSLADADIPMVAIVKQAIRDAQGAPALVLNSAYRSYVATTDGDVVASDNGELYGTSTLRSDYSELALETGGLVADLNQLRAGGLTADSFTLAFVDSLVNIVVVVVGSEDLLSIVENPDQKDVAVLIAGIVKGNTQNPNREVYVNLLKINSKQKQTLLRLTELQGMRRINANLIGGAHTYSFVLQDHFISTARESRRRQTNSDHEDRPKWNTFVQGVYNDSELDAGDGESEDTAGLAGADYRWNARFVTGLAIGYKDDQTDFNDGSELETATATLLGYSSLLVGDEVAVNGVLSYGRSTAETTRPTSVFDPSAPDATAETDADIWSAALGASWNKRIKRFTARPYSRIQWVGVNTDSYAEKGGGALAQSVDANHTQSLRSYIGFLGDYEIDLGNVKLIPHANVEWVHEFMDDTDSVGVTFAGNDLTYTLDAPERDFGRIGIGTTLELNRNSSLVFNALQSIDNSRKDTLSLRLSYHQAF